MKVAFNFYKGSDEYLQEGEWIELCEAMRDGYLPKEDEEEKEETMDEKCTR